MCFPSNRNPRPPTQGSADARRSHRARSTASRSAVTANFKIFWSLTPTRNWPSLVARSKGASGKEAKPEDTEKVQVTVPTSPMQQFGLIMSMGTISAVQAHSPAAKAGIQAEIC